MASKRRKEVRDYRRKPPSREPRFRILVVCEGAVTERGYLKAFQHKVKSRRVHVELPDEPGVPLTVVKTAIRRSQEADLDAQRAKDDNLRFDAVWGVVDVDQHPDLAQAIELARSSGIALAISNPCFELWALLHFEEQHAHIERHVAASRLRRHCKDYEKALPCDDLLPNYATAVERAKQLSEEALHHEEPGRNPTTDVYLLTELIRTK